MNTIPSTTDVVNAVQHENADNQGDSVTPMPSATLAADSVSTKNMVVALVGSGIDQYPADMAEFLSRHNVQISTNPSTSELQQAMVQGVQEGNPSFLDDLGNFLAGIVGHHKDKTGQVHPAVQGYIAAGSAMKTSGIWNNPFANASGITERIKVQGSFANADGATSSSFFSTDNLKNAINSGLSLWSSSINQSAANTSQQNALLLAQTNLQTAQVNAAAKNTTSYAWVWWGLGLLALGGLTFVIVKTLKK